MKTNINILNSLNESFKEELSNKKKLRESSIEDLLKEPKDFKYQLLDRLKQDCEYYLGYGNKNAKYLWSKNEKQQIEDMKALYNSFKDDEKPEWLTMEDINNYAKEMGVNNINESDESFSGIEFEKKIPHNMRFKEYNILDNSLDLYWVTQQVFNMEDLKQFQKAFKNTPFVKAYVTVRDFSEYNPKEIETKNIFAIVTKNSIDATGYKEACEKRGWLEDEEIKSDSWVINESIDDESKYTDFVENKERIKKEIPKTLNKNEATFEIDYADDDLTKTEGTKKDIIKSVTEWLGDLAKQVKVDVEAERGPSAGWPVVRLTGNKEKIAKFLLANFNSGDEETLDDIYDLYLKESSMSDIKDKLDKYEIIADTKADRIIKEYFKGNFDLAELHNKLEKYFGSKAKAAKYLIAREQEIKKEIPEILGKNPNSNHYDKRIKVNVQDLENRLTKNNLKESVTINEIEEITQRIEAAEDMDEIQQIIYMISDGVLEDEVQNAFDGCNEDDDLDEVKSLVLTTLEDNAEYDDLEESTTPNIEKFIYDLDKDTGNAWSVNYNDRKRGVEVYRNGKSEKTIDDIIKAVTDKYPQLEVANKANNTVLFKYKNLTEEETIEIPATSIEPDYTITDVTILDNTTDGDVQSPDIDSLLSLVNESLSESYGKDWGHINILSSNKTNESSFALVDISTKEILKEFEDKGLHDIAIGKSLILESIGNGRYTFKVNSLAGNTKFSKVTTDALSTIREWVETEFLREAKAEKEQTEKLLKTKEQREVTEEYINNRSDLRMEIENIKMFIELSKQVKAQEEMKPAIQDRMYAFVSELPQSIEIDEKKGLSFTSRDEAVEQIFGKEWVKETDNIPEVVELKESYQQFNIGEIEVVFNPDTYECLYSIPSADVKDKKINLADIPSVDTPYDTNTIIKSYVETKFGSIPTSEKEIDKSQNNIPAENTSNNISTEDLPIENTEQLPEAKLPEEPNEEANSTEDIETDVNIDDIDKDTEKAQAETGNAVFMKIRPHQKVTLEDLRNRQLDGDTPVSEYIVVGHKDLSEEEWNQFTENLNEPQSWLEGVKAIDRKNYSFNVLEVTTSSVDYSLLVDPLGYDYARYIGIKQ